MRKAIVDKTTDEVRNVVSVAEPRTLDTTVVKKVIRPARPEARWVNKKTGETVIKEAQPEVSRYVFNAPGHGLGITAGPFMASGDVPPELDGATEYFVKVLGPDEFLLKAAMEAEPVEMTPAPDVPGNVTLTEKAFDPGSEAEMVDDDGTARRGGKWNRAEQRFEAPPPVTQPSAADRAEEQIRGNPAMLAMGRMVTGNDALTEDEWVTQVRGKLPDA